MRPPGDPFHERLVAAYLADPAVPARVDRGAGVAGHRLGRAGAATASLPPGLTAANQARILASLARCRITIDRNRHHERKPGSRSRSPRSQPARTGTARPRCAITLK